MGLHVGLSATNVYMEGDSSHVISTITNLRLEMDQGHPLLLDMQSWIQCCNNFIIGHIYRKVNKMANFIAKYVHQGECSWTADGLIHGDIYIYIFTILRPIERIPGTDEDGSSCRRGGLEPADCSSKVGGGSGSSHFA